MFNKYLIKHKMKRIQGHLHRIGTYGVCKNFFVCFDDKRYILNDGINSLAYVHKEIKSQYNQVNKIKRIKGNKINRINRIDKIKSSQVNEIKSIEKLCS